MVVDESKIPRRGAMLISATEKRPFFQGFKYLAVKHVKFVMKSSNVNQLWLCRFVGDGVLPPISTSAEEVPFSLL
jgi:hypothetical protein